MTTWRILIEPWCPATALAGTIRLPGPLACAYAPCLPPTHPFVRRLPATHLSMRHRSGEAHRKLAAQKSARGFDLNPNCSSQLVPRAFLSLQPSTAAVLLPVSWHHCYCCCCYCRCSWPGCCCCCCCCCCWRRAGGKGGNGGKKGKEVAL